MKQLNNLTDEELVSLYIQGNGCAFDILLNRYKGVVFNYLNYTFKNQEQAEDAFQDVFMKVVVYLNSGKYQENGKFSNWLMRIVRNMLIDQYRRAKNEISIVSNDESEVDLFNNPTMAVNENREQELIDQQTMSEVKFLIELLPDNQREVLLLRYFEDLSFKEIAEKTNCSINTALGRMRYAIMNLKKLALQYDIAG